MRRAKFGFTFKMLLFAATVIIISAIISAAISFVYGRIQLERNLSYELLGIVNSVTPSIDGDRHENIYRDMQGNIQGKPAFENIRSKLVKVKDNTRLHAHKGSSPIYTLRKAYDFDQSKQLEFVVMTDRNEVGKFFVGNLIKAEPHHLRALAGKATATKIYKDAEGYWISAVAPIRDSNNEVVAIIQADHTIKTYYRERMGLAHELFLGAFVSIALALALAVFFARRLSRPVKQLVKAANRMGAGDLTQPIAMQRKDELGVLAQTFDAMQDNIRKHRENLESLVETRTYELLRVKDKAESANRAKSAFLANMGHELRTPLNAVIGLSEMLLEDVKEDKADDYIEPLERIHRAGSHLLSLINDVLDLSKVEAGRMELALEEADFVAVLSDIKMLAEPLATKNNNQFVVNNISQVDRIYNDTTKFKQIVLNLLSNAAKFTQNGTITLQVKAEKVDSKDWLAVSVIDTGIGMTHEQTAKVFERFTQAEAATSKKYGGTGLGMTISRKICQMMGGDITVKSELNVGTTFTAHVPVRVLPEGEHKAQQAQSLIAGSKKISASQREKTGLAREILIIEDDVAARKLLQESLSKKGYKTRVAADGETGLRFALEKRPAVILLDIMLPDRSGWEILHDIKQNPRTKDIFVIITSALDEKQKGFTLGATDYLVKPIQREALLDTVNKYLPQGQAKILIVDDDKDVRLQLATILEGEHYSIKEAANGKVALEMLQVDRPDLILLDLIMPEMDGFEFLQELRKTSLWEDIYVIVITAKDLTQADVHRLAGQVSQIYRKGEDMQASLLDPIHALIDKILPGEG